MTNELQLWLLGHLDIELNGAPVTGFDSNKVKALLCYLAVTGRPHTRHTLTGLLWGDMPEAEAKVNLRVALSNLRRLLEPYLDISRDRVAFKPEPGCSLDVQDFLALLDLLGPEPTPEQLGRAMALYRGDFLEGFYVREAPDFEEWVVSQRERLRELALHALQKLVNFYAGSHAQAIEYARRLLALAPWREETHRQLMRLLAYSGQYSTALAQYESCRRVLAEELGVEPALETQTLYERIQAARFRPAHNLPAQTTAFIGRTEELAEINRRLADPACRLLSIVGLGGVGKTRLALESARRQSGQFLEGVYFVPLAALTTPDLLLPAIAEALNFSFVAEGSLLSQLLHYLRDKELLLVLDNFEQFLSPPELGPANSNLPGSATALLAEILQRATGVKVLVTSRERLNLQSEWLFETTGLEFPTASLPPPKPFPRRRHAKREGEGWVGVEQYSAVQLFLQSVRQLQADFVPTEADFPWLTRICQLVQGLPLGLELAATWVRLLSCREIAQEIERGLNFLATSLRDVPERHRSLQAVFEYSWKLLLPEEQEVFMKLSVFRGGFRREAAAKVAGATLSTLSTLVDKSFLRRTAGGRYDLHELLRQYATEKLSQAPETATQTRQAHLIYYADFMGQKEYDLKTNKLKASLQEIGQEVENVRTAWGWAIEHGCESYIDPALESLYRFFDMQSRYQEGLEICNAMAASLSRRISPADSASTAAASPVEVMQARVGIAQASYYESLSLYEQAGKLLHDSLAVFRRAKTDVRRETGYTLFMLGVVNLRLGDYEAARQLFEESLAIFEAMDSPYEIAFVLDMLGSNYFHQGNYQQAKNLFQRCLALRKEIDERWGIADVLVELALLAEADEAEALYQESLAIFREINDQAGIARVLVNLGSAYIGQNRYLLAAQTLPEAVTIAQEIGSQRILVHALSNLGVLAHHQGDHAEAKRLLEACLRLCQDLDYQAGLATIYSYLGQVAQALGERQTAELYLGQTQKIAAEVAESSVTTPVLGVIHL